MLKSGFKDLRENIKFLPIVAVVLLSKIFFEAVEVGLTEPLNIAIEVATGLAFSLYFISTLTRKSFGSISAQTVAAVITLAFTLGIVISHTLISADILLAILLVSVVIVLSQHFCLLPVAVLLCLGVSFADHFLHIQFAATSCIPAAISVSCVCLSEELRKSAVWKKILFAVYQLVLIASIVRVLYVYRFTLTVHALVTQVWDSIVSIVAIIILLVFTVYAIKMKKSIGEIFGYFAAAAFGAAPIFMEMKFPLVSAMSMLMIATLFVKEGKTAEGLFAPVIDGVKSKINTKQS